MSHVTLRSGYTELVDRLNRFPQGAAPSDTLYKILEVLFSEREAEVVAQLPIKPFTASKASRILKMDLTETRNILDELASRAILVDVEHEGESTYTLPPPMAWLTTAVELTVTWPATGAVTLTVTYAVGVMVKGLSAPRAVTAKG